MQNLSSNDHRTPVTCDEWPLYSLYIWRGVQTGYLKTLTFEKSSPLARYFFEFERSTELTSDPSEQGGQIPRVNHVNLDDMVAHCYPFNDETAVICEQLLVL